MPEQLKLSVLIEVDKKTGKIKVAGKEVEQFGDKTAKAGKQSKKAGEGFKQLAQAAGGLLVLRQISAFFVDATKEAIAFQEVQSKFDTVFRNNTEAAEDFSRELVQSFNLSEAAAKKNLASIQDLLVPMGLMRSEAASLSLEIVKLAADLGSFNDVPTEIVIRDLQSALVGNTETVKKYGVVLKATDIAQRAMTDSGKQSAEALTNAEKVVAAYKIILEATADAQGDVARTAGSQANQIKNLTAKYKDLTVAIGEELSPALDFWIKLAQKGVEIALNAVAAEDKELKGRELTIKALKNRRDALVMSMASTQQHAAAIKTSGDVELSIFAKLLNAAKERLGFTEQASVVTLESLDREIKRNQDLLEIEERRATERSKKAEQEEAALEAAQAAADKVREVQTSLDDFIKEAEKAGETSKLISLQNALDEKIQMLRQAGADEIQLAQATAAKQKLLRQGLDKFSKASNAKRLDDTRSSLQFITSSALSENKKLAGILKGAAIASALIDTYKGATKAFGQGGFLGFAMAAAVTAAGLANVAKIQSTPAFRHGGTTRGGTVLVGEGGPELVDLPKGSQVSTASETRRLLEGGIAGITINNLTVIANSPEDAAELFIEALGDRLEEDDITTDRLGKLLSEGADRFGERAT